MKSILTLAAAALCLSFSQPNAAAAPEAAKTVKAQKSFFAFPQDVDWKIGYHTGLPMVSLHWTSFTFPPIGPVPVTFNGVTQMINPNTQNNCLFGGASLVPMVSYTMNIAGVNYYFYSPYGGGLCVITGHS